MRSSMNTFAARAVVGAGAILASALWVGTAQATYIAESEPNDSFATAQNVDGAFSLDLDSDIGDIVGNTSTTIPHASVRATGNATLDYYSFTVAATNTKVILDIDYGAPNLDSSLWLFHASDLVNEVNNDYDSDATHGAGGSTANLGGGLSDDAYIETTVASAGLYYVVVGSPAVGSPGYTVVPDGTSYTLHISVDQAVTVPAPAALPLFAAGLLGIGWARRRRS